MKIAIAGSSGLIGNRLVSELRAAGHRVLRLVRRPTTAADEIAWVPERSELSVVVLGDVDAVINLAGENIAEGRWTRQRREQILRSRIDATRTLVAAVGRMEHKPKVFLNASAVGFYGDRGDEELTENSDVGHGFLPEVCLAWETHAEGATRQGVRTVLLRFGTVLSRDGGALAKLLPVFRAGFGGRLGRGQQWMSWIGIDDAVGAIQHALVDERCRGPINLVSPTPVRNVEFTATLTHVLRRPALMAVPAFALRLAFGQVADEALLASTRALPEKLLRTGYTFQHPTLAEALRVSCLEGR
jgi:uncharacterized protein (TIGR01777 family)